MEQRSILPGTWGVPAEFRKRLGDRAGRQRPMLAEGHLLLVLHKPPKPNETERQGRFFWRKPDGTWTTNDLGSGIGAMTRHLAEYAEQIQGFEKMDESAQTSAEYFQVLDGVAPLHRAATHLHQVLQEARKMVPEDRSLINFRDQAYDLERTADLLYTSAKNGLDYAIARRAEEEASASRKMALSAHRLNMLVAFFFPLATISGVFGVSFPTGVERWLQPPWGLPILIGIGLVAGFMLATAIAKPQKH